MPLTACVSHFQEDVVADPQKAMECSTDNVCNFHLGFALPGWCALETGSRRKGGDCNEIPPFLTGQEVIY